MQEDIKIISNVEKSKQVKNIGIVMFLTLLSKIFGFTRDVVLAYFYGVTNIADAYLISLTIPEFVFNLATQAIAVGFIPIFVELANNESELNAHKFTNEVLTALYLFCFVVLFVLNIFPQFFVNLFASGFDAETVNLTISFVRIISVGLFFKGTVSVLSAYCHAKGEFTRPAMIGLALDVIVIVSIIISYKTNLLLLAYGTVVAYAFELFILIPFCLKSGFRFKMSIDCHDSYLKRMISLFLPVIVGVGSNQINILVDKTLASTISVGGISALNYANKIDLMMENVIILSIAGIMYPTFASFAAKNDYSGLGDSVRTTLDEVMLIMMPITIGSIIFAEPIIEILFSRGAFGSTGVSMTSQAMIGYSVGIIGVSFRAILTRVFYSLQDVKTPAVNSAISVVINIVLNLILSRILGIGGLALASSVSSLFCSILLLLSLKDRIGFDCKCLLLNGIKVFLISLAMGVISYFSFEIMTQSLNKIVSLLLSVVIGVFVYGLFVLCVKLPSVVNLIDMLKGHRN